MLDRMLTIGVFHIDTNLINAKQKNADVNQLEKWNEDGVIIIHMSKTASFEAKAGDNALRTRKTNGYITTETTPIDESHPRFKEFAEKLFGKSELKANEINDVCIVCEACQYNAILVTNDGGSKSQPGGILGNRHKFEGLVKILSPSEAVSFINEKICERDRLNTDISKNLGISAPDHTGKDQVPRP